MMEERKIIRQSVSRGYESNNYKFWLADHPDQETLWKQGKIFLTYKVFLFDLFGLLSTDEEIKLLFDPASLYSILFPNELSIRSLFEILNSESLSEIWKEDETIGWVYQYFIEDEKALVFDKIYQKKKKLDLRDIPAATQIFTPKWIVKWIVENTLGRLWLRMHPDSGLGSKMAYFVPNDQDKNQLPFKAVSVITLLDPACGTMHFGMYAFDLFFEMYLEEFNNANKPGWPEKASVSSIDDISRSIIENNLFGIDIDFRAIQLSALSLYLKAKSKNKNIVLSKYNLTCTDIPPFTDAAINSFIDELSVEHAITKKLLQQILPLLNKAYYLGSLLKIEDVVDSFVVKEKVSLKSSYQLELFSSKPQSAQKELDLYIEKKIIWDDVRKELRAALTKFSELNKDQLGGFLAGESVKGLNLIDALIRKHDVVVANPPFSGRRNWSKQLNKDLKALYNKSAYDLYSCFISRCLELTNDNGFTGMISIHSFMFTSSFETLRQNIIENCTIESLVHLGPTFMELSNPYAQQCAMYSFNRKCPIKTDNGIYFRVVNYFYNEKEKYYISLLKSYRCDINNVCQKLNQDKLKIIPGWPFVYWVSDKIRDLFKEKLLGDVSDAVQGLATTNNAQFLRLWWEIGTNNINFNITNSNETFQTSLKWFPYMKGGGVLRWYGNQEYVVNYLNNGDEVKKYVKEKYRDTSYAQGFTKERWDKLIEIWVVKNQQYYFQEGVTYSFLTISDLSVRYMPQGFIFDVAGSSVFSNKLNIYLILGLLNSKITAYLIKLISPTVNYQVGDIARIPIPDFINKEEAVALIIQKVTDCISSQKQNVYISETSWEFNSPQEWNRGIIDFLHREQELALYYTDISKSFYDLFSVKSDDINQIELEFGKLPGNLIRVSSINEPCLEVLTNLYLQKHIPSAVIKINALIIDEDNDDEINDDTEQENDKKTSRGKQARFLSFEEICLASGFHPETVYNYIVSNKLGRPEERYELAVRWISYAIGIVMGRFNVDGIIPDEDGICALDEGHSDDFPKLVYEVLLKVMDEKSAGEVVEVINNKPTDKSIDVLRKFLEKDFFTKWHIPMYKKRPVYWLLQSKNKNYGLYIYNQKFTSESLYTIIQKYIDSKLKLERTKSAELNQKKSGSNDPAEKRKIDKDMAKIDEVIIEVEQFKKEVQAVIDSGFTPDIDDGVILNMAPLHKLIPSWSEPSKFYKKLKEGDFEWSSVSKALFQQL